MCRWLAYSGESIFLDELLFKPEHSLRSSLRLLGGDQTIIRGRDRWERVGDPEIQPDEVNIVVLAIRPRID